MTDGVLVGFTYDKNTGNFSFSKDGVAVNFTKKTAENGEISYERNYTIAPRDANQQHPTNAAAISDFSAKTFTAEQAYNQVNRALNYPIVITNPEGGKSAGEKSTTEIPAKNPDNTGLNDTEKSMPLFSAITNQANMYLQSKAAMVAWAKSIEPQGYGYVFETAAKLSRHSFQLDGTNSPEINTKTGYIDFEKLNKSLPNVGDTDNNKALKNLALHEIEKGKQI